MGGKWGPTCSDALETDDGYEACGVHRLMGVPSYAAFSRALDLQHRAVMYGRDLNSQGG